MIKLNNGSDWLASELVRLDKIKHKIRQKINTASEAVCKSLKNDRYGKKKNQRTT
jgi:hypothetical protein